MPINSKVKEMHSLLQRAGADVGDLTEFNNWFFAKGDEGYNNRKYVFDTFKRAGADVGNDYEEFAGMLGLQAVKPGQANLSRSDDESFNTTLRNTRQTIGQSQQTVNRIGNREQRIGLDLPKTDYGRIDLSQNRKVTTGQQRFNLGTGQMENTYITEAGNEYDTRAGADIEQNALDDFNRRQANPFGTDMEDAYQEQRSLDSRIAELEAKRNAAMRENNGFVYTDRNLFTDEEDNELQNLKASKRQNDQRIITFEREKEDYETSGIFDTIGKAGGDFFKGMYDMARNPSTYSFGISDLADMTQLYKIKQKMDAAKEAGVEPELTDAEQSLLQNTMLNNYTNQQYGDNRSDFYGYGQIAMQAIPFVAEFYMTGGLKGLSEMGANYGAKKAADWALKGWKAKAVKNLGVLAGDLAAGWAMANTTGAAKSAADILGRHIGDVYVDKDGQYYFDDGKSLTEAVYEGQLVNTFEYYTEKLGDHLNIGGFFAKGAEKYGLSKLSKAVTFLSGSKAMKALGVHDYPSEVIEEEANLLLNATFGLDNNFNIAPLKAVTNDILGTNFEVDRNSKEYRESIFNGKTQKDIVYGMFFSLGVLNAPRYAQTGYTAAKYKQYQHKVDMADTQAATVFGADNWQMIKEQIDNCTNEDMAGLMQTVADGKMTPEQKAATARYAANLMTMRGYNSALMSMLNGGEEDVSPKAQAANAVNQSYTEGYNTEDPDLRKQYQDEAMQAKQTLPEYGEQFAKMVTESQTPVETLDYLMQNRDYFTDEQIIAAYDYYSKTARINGAMEGALNQIDLQVEQETAQVRANTHQGTDNVYLAKLPDNSDCYVIGGDIVTDGNGLTSLVGTGGAVVVRNPVTGEVSVKSPKDVMIYQIDASDNLINYYNTEYRQQLMQDADDDFTYGSPANEVYQLEDTVALNDGQGNIIEGEIVGMPNSIDGVYQVQTNDTNEPMKYLTADELNRRIATHNGQEVQRANQQPIEQNQQEIAQIQPENAKIEGNYTQNQGENIQGSNLDNATGKKLTNEEGGESTQPQSASRIPVDASGQPDYLQAQPQDSYDALVEDLGEDDANAIIESEVNDAQKRLSRLKKQQPKGATIEEKKRNLAERRKAMDAEKAKIDYWNSVLEIPKSRKAEADLMAEEEAQRKAIEERKAQMQTPEGRQQLLDEAKNTQERVTIAKEIYGEYFNDNISEPDTVEELVSLLLPYGKLNWEGYDRGDRHVNGLQQELGSGHTRGLSKDRGTSGFNSYLAKKGEGESLDSIVHAMYEDDANISGDSHKFTTEEIKDAAIEMLLQAEKPSDIRNYTLNNRIYIAERNMRAEQDAEAEDWADFYHLTPEEREAFEDYVMKMGNEKSQLSDNDIKEIISIFADEYAKIEEYEQQNRGSQKVDQQPDEGTADRESKGGEGQVQGQPAGKETAGADNAGQRTKGTEAGTDQPIVSGDNVSGGTQEPVIAPSEQLKPTDLRDAIRVESPEIGVAEANAKARRTSGETDPRTMSEEEKQRRGELLRNAPSVTVEPNQITATPELSARKAAEKWWDEHVPGPQFFDTEVGEVEINRNSVESSLAHRYSQMKLDAITSLVDGFENAVYLGTLPDGTRQEGVKNHYFSYPVIYNGQRCYVFCRALHDNNTNRLYVHEVFLEQNIKKGNTLQTAASQPHGGIALYRDILANVLDSSSGEDVIADLREPGQSDAATDVSKPQTPNENGRKPINAETQASSSEGKDTNNSSNLQEKTEKSSEKSANKEPKRLVSDDRMEELKKQLRSKLGGQLNVGVDPEVLSLGAQLAVGYLERGVTKFADYAKTMIEEVGDFMRPYLKAFYNAVRDMPEAESYADQMDDYETVRKFDVHNFDKGGKVPDAITKAEQIVNEQKVTKQAKKIKKQHPNLFEGDLFSEQDSNTSTPAQIAAEEDKVDTNPSEAQKEAGNYQKGHIKVDGYDITIENPKGSIRRGTDANGKAWEIKMNNTYGYIRGTESVDGDHIDIFLSDNPASGNVYVVDQVKPDGSFDEVKVLYGFGSEEEAREAYLSNYSKGWKGLGNITEVSREDFKKWIQSSHRKTKPFAEYKSVVKSQKQKHLQSVKDRVAEHLKKYKTLAPVEVISIDSDEDMKRIAGKESDKVRQYLKDSKLPAVYDTGAKKIYIFAENIESDDIEQALFHESVHRGLHQYYGDGLIEVAEAFWETESPDKPEASKEHKKNVVDAYKDKPNDIKEEYLVNLLGLHMVKGKVKRILSRLSKEHQEIINNILHNIGYDTAEETKQRGNKEGSEDGGTLASPTQSKDRGGIETDAPSSREKAMRDALVDLMRDAGIDVITDWKEGQRILDEYNGREPLSKSKKRALETASLPSEEDQPTVVSSADGAKILKNLDTLAKDFENLSNQPKFFIGSLAKKLKAKRDGSKSEYATFETKNGKIVTIRLADHNATVSDFDHRNENDGISIVITAKDNDKIINDGKAHIVEFFYDAIKLRRADGKPLVDIIKSIQQSLYSGEYKDTTGLAEREEVNAEEIRQHKVYFFRTKDGLAYGYTYNGKVYIDPSIATSETPIHEYTHLWAEAMRQNDEDTWNQIVDVLKNDEAVKPFWDKVTSQYPELTDDNDIAEEVLAQYSGKRGFERMREVADEIQRENKGIFGKAQAIEAIRKMKSVLAKFWKGVADMMGWQFDSAEDIADKVLYDLLSGVNPNPEGKRRIRPQKIDDVAQQKKTESPDEKPVNMARQIYEDAIRDTGDRMMIPSMLASIFNKESRERFKHKFAESWFDYSRSIKALQDAIEKATGKTIQGFEEVWRTLNAKSSIDNDQIQKVMHNLIEPLSEFVGNMVKDKEIDGHRMTLDDVEKYMNAVHGIERNIGMAKKQAKDEYEENIAMQKQQLESGELKGKERKSVEDALLIKEARFKGIKNYMDNEVVAKWYSQWNRSLENARTNGTITDEEYNKARKEMDAEYENGWQYKYRNKDYSGLTALFADDFKDKKPTEDQLEQAAKDYADKFEKIVGKKSADGLWQRVKALNEWSLRKSYESGLISKDQMNDTLSMYRHYIPLRGWHDDYAGDVYQYISRGEPAEVLQGVLKKAYGRKSRAARIFGTMAAMANTAIVQGNKNLVAQHLLNMALNHRDAGLLMPSEQYYQKNADGQMVPQMPALNDNMTPEEMRQELERFEAEMKAKEDAGEVQTLRSKFRKEFPLHMAKWQEQRHAVRVMRNGKEYMVYILGNPRAAEAFNGILNPHSQPGAISNVINKWNRWLAKWQTSLSPEFLFSNFQRDVMTATTGAYIKFGNDYKRQFEKNILSVMPLTKATLKKLKGDDARNLGGIFSLLRKYDSGTLDMNDETERLFKEFVEGGGMTGISHITKAEEYQESMEKMIRRMRQGKMGKVRKGWEAVGDGIEFLNKGIENATRFATYMTSRQQGRSIRESIFDAKEASVNFNMKGSGAWGNMMARRLYLYVNPSMQALRMLGTWYENDPVVATKEGGKMVAKAVGKRFLKTAAGVVTASVTCAIINNLLSQLFHGDGDDDDKEKGDWWALSEWNRYNYINVINPFGKGYFHWSIPQELRPLWAMGQIAVDMAFGRKTWQSGLQSTVLQLNNLSPLSFFEGGTDGGETVIESELRTMTPSFLAPFFDAYFWNRDFMGQKITNRFGFNKNDPEWKRAGDDTPKAVINASRKLNEITGGADNSRGWLEDNILGGTTNPSALYYLATQQFGGVGSMTKRLFNLIDQATDSEKDVELRNIPFVPKVYVSTGDDYSRQRVMNDKFWMYYNEYKGADHEISKNKKDVEAKEMTQEYADKRIEERKADGTYNTWKIFKENDFNYIFDKLRGSKQEDNVKRMVVDAIENGKMPDYEAMLNDPKRDTENDEFWHKVRTRQIEYKVENMKPDEAFTEFDKTKDPMMRKQLAKRISKDAGASEDPYGNKPSSDHAYQYQVQRTAEDVREDALLYARQEQLREEGKDEEKDQLSKERKDVHSVFTFLHGGRSDVKVMNDIRENRKRLLKKYSLLKEEK